MNFEKLISEKEQTRSILQKKDVQNLQGFQNLEGL